MFFLESSVCVFMWFRAYHLTPLAIHLRLFSFAKYDRLTQQVAKSKAGGNPHQRNRPDSHFSTSSVAGRLRVSCEDFVLVTLFPCCVCCWRSSKNRAISLLGGDNFFSKQ
ncbi:hypothetical protein TNIN_363791 [Trichonephila inaurata madagascariensis]|uniref:Uncharacterized protein n=1 Tax=Trichonephila inaurata madagascariensis TaxID=2747483 RepID=A0A8X6IEE8_9ARAC|nr:hypothetical protein TNIN_363761 [Trichonephila inaurata madagascariensis]GFS42618.1 hypothetical protein TNIN_363791 [Trichonephila inaurata madagascariensis]